MSQIKQGKNTENEDEVNRNQIKPDWAISPP